MKRHRPPVPRHRMGGHTFVKTALVLDIRGFNQVRLDKEHKILNVQTGATLE